jgi:Protein of unknown function (DUF2809)
MTRLYYFAVTIVLMIIGLLSRHYTQPNDFIYDYVGDAIWAGMIYLGFRFLMPSAKIKSTVLIALAFCYLIEISQLNQSEWLNALRRTTLGGLILGFGFLWSDFLMYTLGIIAAALIDIYGIQKLKSSDSRP